MLKEIVSAVRENLHLQVIPPKVSSKIPGFSVKIRREEGAIFRSKDPDEPLPCTPRHFVVEVSYDGSDPRYALPPGICSTTRLTRLRVGSDHAFQMIGSSIGFAPSERITKIVLGEKLEDWRGGDFLVKNAPCVMAMLQVYCKNNPGPTSLGFASRPLPMYQKAPSSDGAIFYSFISTPPNKKPPFYRGRFFIIRLSLFSSFFF